MNSDNCPKSSISIQNVIGDFERFLGKISSKASQSPAYADMKKPWFDLLEFLKPVVTDRYFSNEESRTAAKRFQNDFTSVETEGIEEKALCFGLLSFYGLYSNKVRHLYYASVNRDEIAKKWNSAALYPEKALEEYRFFEFASKKIVEHFADVFFQTEILPHVKDPHKQPHALQCFISQFYSGILLGQIHDGLILREYYRIQEKR